MDIDAALRKVSAGPMGHGYFETLIYIIYRDWIAKPGSTAIDIGANLGLHTFRLADCVGEKGRVLAFEPLPELATPLREKAKECDGRVNILEMAVSDEEGTAFFHRNTKQHSQSTLIEGHAPNKAETERFPVSITTLDKVAEQYGLSYVSVLKIDAESAEYKILDGGRNFFKKSSPLTIIEFSSRQLKLIGKTEEDFFRLSDEIGYVWFNIDGSEYDRDFVATREKGFRCYERFGAKRGHWIEGFLRDRMRGIVERQIERRAETIGVTL